MYWMGTEVSYISRAQSQIAAANRWTRLHGVSYTRETRNTISMEVGQMAGRTASTNCVIAMPRIEKRANLDRSFAYPRHQWLGTESAAARRGAGDI